MPDFENVRPDAFGQERSYTDEKSDCETKLQKLKTDYENLKTVFDSNSELYKAIRRDDQQIENTEKEKNDKEKLKNDLSKELTKLKTQCKKLTKDLEAQKNDLTEKKQYIEAHKNDELTVPTTVAITNTPGVEMPATGGEGISRYYATGALLMASACIYGIVLKRKRERRAA